MNLSQRLRLLSDEVLAAKSLVENKQAAGKLTRASRAIVQAVELIEAHHVDSAQIPMWPDESTKEELGF